MLRCRTPGLPITRRANSTHTSLVGFLNRTSLRIWIRPGAGKDTWYCIELVTAHREPESKASRLETVAHRLAGESIRKAHRGLPRQTLATTEARESTKVV